MAEYVADELDDHIAPLTGTYVTDEANKILSLTGDGEGDTGFVFPSSSEWLLIEVYDVGDVYGDIGYHKYSDNTTSVLESIENARVSHGEEVIENGAFGTDTVWLKDTGWTISDGKARATSAAFGRPLYQTVIFTVGKTYSIRFNVSDYVDGEIRLWDAVGGHYGQTISSNGNYEVIWTAQDGDFHIDSFSATPLTCSIDNVSAKEILPIYPTFKITAIHYKGDETADIYRGDESTVATLDNEALTYTPSTASWKLTTELTTPLNLNLVCAESYDCDSYWICELVSP